MGLGPWAHMGLGKISQARSPRQGVLGKVSYSSIGKKYAALTKHIQHWRKICNIGETYAALPKNIAQSPPSPSPNNPPRWVRIYPLTSPPSPPLSCLKHQPFKKTCSPTCGSVASFGLEFTCTGSVGGRLLRAT